MFDYKSLWAKKSRGDENDTWLPLEIHLQDCAHIAEYLWKCWLSKGAKTKIIADVGGEDTARNLYVFLAYAHDIGKACKDFQEREKTVTPIRHEILSHAILRAAGFDHSIAVVAGGHHGVPPSTGQMADLASFALTDVHEYFISKAVDFAGIDIATTKQYNLSRQAQALLSGLVIMADWISSTTDYMPLIGCHEYDINNMLGRVSNAWQKLALPTHWQPATPSSDFYGARFNISTPRPTQEAVLSAVQNAANPGIYIIEAPMGEGKTEAALAAAEILAQKFGLRGVYFALPSQATSNAMFERVCKWLDKFDGDLSIALRHSKADLNLSQSTIFAEHDGLVVHEWLAGRKKGMLADFCVGTIDHVLMVGLKQKHLVLRHLGLANKVIIIDEVHAYDIYMESYLLKALNWLGAYGVPVVVLSATLPVARRAAVLAAYQNKKTCIAIDGADYPRITYTEGTDIKTLTPAPSSRRAEVTVIHLQNEFLLQTLENKLAEGGYAGIIANTVKEAQRLYSELSPHFECILLHAGFIYADRKQKEDALVSDLGKSNLDKRTRKRVVIGTQIFEQSMDIDFDILFTQLCPIDLLLQRIGRLHRHERPRPRGLYAAKCYVLPPDDGTNAVYGEYLLKRTENALASTITLPQDIPSLVSAVYDNEDTNNDWVKFQQTKVQKARAFQIGNPKEDDSLLDWLSRKQRDSSEHLAEATVRDAADCVEVLVVSRCGDELYVIQGNEHIPRGTPNDTLAMQIALSSLRLPAFFGKAWMVDKVIREVESEMSRRGIVETWYLHPLLKGQLVLILDENMQATLCGHVLKYDRILGISHRKEEDNGKSI